MIKIRCKLSIWFLKLSFWIVPKTKEIVPMSIHIRKAIDQLERIK